MIGWRLSAAAMTLGLAAGFAGSAQALEAWKGDQKALVVLVEWGNKPAEVSRAKIRNTFFGTEKGARSLKQYFLENSGGTFDLSGRVLPWETVATRWSPSQGCRLEPIVEKAWDLVDGEVDTAKYDADGNGKIDNFFVVHSGRIGHDRVGPSCTFSSHRNADHAIVFQSQGLGSIGTGIPIGFYIHEGGHGYYDLPDLYGNHYHGRYGIGMWGMMGLGAWGVRNDISRGELFREPAHFEPLSKVRIGWVEPRVVETTTRNVEIRPVETTNDIVAVPAGWRENFYLEYRSNRGFSEGHRGHGLLVWKNYDLIQADGRDDLNNGNDLGRRPLPPIDENFGDATDPFPGANQVTSYEDPRAGVRFENIEQYEDRIVLDIVVENDVTPPYLPPRPRGFSGEERL